MNDLIWLEKWYIINSNKDWEKRAGIQIATVDNPGWYVTINLSGTEYQDRNFPYVKFDYGDNDWYFCLRRNNNFEASGNPFKLSKIIEVFLNWINKDKKKFEDDKIDFLQIWYQNQCDGDWEHEFGIEINTVNLQDWKVEIDLIYTELESKPFDPINKKTDEKNWVHCEIKKNKFLGYGGPQNLSTIIKIFIDLAKE